MDRWELSDPDGQTERSNRAFGKSDIEGKAPRVAARERGTRMSFKFGGRDEMDGQPEGGECGYSRVNGTGGSGAIIDNAKALGAAREPGGSSQSFCPRT